MRWPSGMGTKTDMRTASLRHPPARWQIVRWRASGTVPGLAPTGPDAGPLCELKTGLPRSLVRGLMDAFNASDFLECEWGACRPEEGAARIHGRVRCGCH